MRFPTSNVLLALLLAGCCVACTPDNAVGLSRSMEEAAAELLATETGHETTVTFTPLQDPERPYTLIFLPDRPTKREDLIARGLPPETANDVFDTLAYVEVGTRPLLVVHRGAGEMSFTGYWTEFAEVDDILLLEGQGESKIVLEQVGDRVRIREIR